MGGEILFVSVLGSRGPSVAVPREGVIVIGRGRDCDLRIDDPLVSRRHAVVHGGDPAMFEELASKNPSLLLRAPVVEQIASARRVPIASGDVIKLGSQLIGIHHGGPAIANMQLDVESFEERIASACAHPLAEDQHLAVIRVQLTTTMSPELAQAALYTLANAARGVIQSVLGAFELSLLVRMQPSAIELELQHLTSQLADLGIQGDIGVAFHPRDGQTPAALLAAARAAVETIRAWSPDTAIAVVPTVRARHPPPTSFIAAQRPAECLVVANGARSLVLPSGKCVDLARHASLRRIVLALARRRRDGISAGLPTDELLACGWPGERVDPFAGSARVRVALSRLRNLGLRDLLVRAEDGYVLAPELAVVIDEAPPDR
jgi:hypothetical protein